MKGNYETIVHPLKPLYGENFKILILGSSPSVKTGKHGFFHGHPQNRFRKLTEKLFNVDSDMSIKEGKKFLLEHNIAMYDSIYKCDIIDSPDSNIKNVAFSNLKEIVDCASIKHTFCNETASYECYERYHAKNLGADCTKLPSTSPANAKYRSGGLVDEREVVLEYL